MLNYKSLRVAVMMCATLHGHIQTVLISCTISSASCAEKLVRKKVRTQKKGHVEP